jgi:Zn-dependent protease
MDLSTATAFIIPLIVAITLHEAAHGYVASKLGDLTAKRMGRVTFDPLRHIDPFGTLLLPAVLLLSGSPMMFGYAKPVPVDFRNLRKPRRDMILVALAGPGMNLLIAFLSALALHILEQFVSPDSAPWTFRNLYASVGVNIVLAVFNMLPILPLDGGRVLCGLLPREAARTYAHSERFGMLIVILIFVVPALLGNPHLMGIAQGLIGIPSDFLSTLIFHAAGIGDNG